MSVKVGSKFLFHDARGERGPYTVTKIIPGAGGISPVHELHRDGVDQAAWASGFWLCQGCDERGVGWEPVA